MRGHIGLSAIGVAALILSASPPHASARDLTNGLAEVTLPACAQGSSQTDTFIPGCSYIRLANKAAPAYTYLTSQGAVSWKGGTLAGTSLSFPAAGQTWPALTDLFLGASTVMTPKDVTGTTDAGGKVDLTMPYNLLFTIGSAQCTLTGTAYLSSQGVEVLGGQAVGAGYDPATGRFAVVSTTYGPPAQSGDCLSMNTAYDLSKGIGWFLTGTAQLPQAPQAQSADVSLPKKVKPKGKTVLLKKAVTTNAVQQATPKVTWSTKKGAKGHKAKYANVEVGKAGKVTITTTGKAKKLYVRLRLSAPAKSGYTAYSFTKRWTVK